MRAKDPSWLYFIIVRNVVSFSTNSVLNYPERSGTLFINTYSHFLRILMEVISLPLVMPVLVPALTSHIIVTNAPLTLMSTVVWPQTGLHMMVTSTPLSSPVQQEVGNVVFVIPKDTYFAVLIVHLLWTLNVPHYQVVQGMNNMSIPLLSNTLLKMTLKNIIVIFVRKNDIQNIGFITVQIVVILLILIAFFGKKFICNWIPITFLEENKHHLPYHSCGGPCKGSIDASIEISISTTGICERDKYDSLFSLVLRFNRNFLFFFFLFFFPSHLSCLLKLDFRATRVQVA